MKALKYFSFLNLPILSQKLLPKSANACLFKALFYNKTFQSQAKSLHELNIFEINYSQLIQYEIFFWPCNSRNYFLLSPKKKFLWPFWILVIMLADHDRIKFNHKPCLKKTCAVNPFRCLFISKPTFSNFCDILSCYCFNCTVV